MFQNFQVNQILNNENIYFKTRLHTYGTLADQLYI